jgi:hypothetical protein
MTHMYEHAEFDHLFDELRRGRITREGAVQLKEALEEIEESPYTSSDAKHGAILLIATLNSKYLTEPT